MLQPTNPKFQDFAEQVRERALSDYNYTFSDNEEVLNLIKYQPLAIKNVFISFNKPNICYYHSLLVHVIPIILSNNDFSFTIFLSSFYCMRGFAYEISIFK